ncbi:YbaB/EbfC family nucleoid-associated protein [Glycomyces niveus]|uniref:YbaB/EbfC family nucleoid-associated protein n=1 Tax=Glycomyces niveus TaxID=2820287 RepID=A0ABS3U4B3_9ACTN|nr:YbaB/EbfC family nucleoid-associated protein [Glycomyces sp. NEAU-S30]MBO3733081.1 YbaB/EbfC family nucleoid-associated protein [Glycomyces sp. NEAU-S30]
MPDIEDARRQLDEWRDRMVAHAENLQAANTELAAVEATYTDPNGVVTVIVDSSGNLKDLTLSTRVQRQAPDVTARQIKEALTAAKALAAQKTQEVASRHFGADSPTTRALVENAGSGRSEEN